MEKIKRDVILVTVYYYEDPDGYIVLDEDQMIKEFHNKLESLYESTKHGKRDYFESKFNQNEEKWKKTFKHEDEQ